MKRGGFQLDALDFNGNGNKGGFADDSSDGLPGEGGVQGYADDDDDCEMGDFGDDYSDGGFEDNFDLEDGDSGSVLNQRVGGLNSVQ